MSYVETENVDAGIVYITDAKQSSLIKIVAIAPVKSHSPVIYPVAVIQNSKKVAQARSFTGFLLNREANNIYRKHGFNKKDKEAMKEAAKEKFKAMMAKKK